MDTNNFSSQMPISSTNDIVDEAESIWSADIEQSFIEALAIYPPCGRRKTILTDEGKMYGRNELVARYIKIRTGKIRTRKQVSSHLQVLAKRRSNDLQTLRNDKQAQQIILERIKQHSSMNIDMLKTDTLAASSNNIERNSIHSTIRMNNSNSHLLSTSSVLNSSDPSCSSNASSLSCSSIIPPNPMINHSIILPLALIGNENFQLYDLSAFIELKQTIKPPHSSLIYPYTETYSSYQHDLLRLHADDIQIKNVQTFETISIDQIFDKFPHYDGLKDLFQQNPNGSFYLIKFWADVSISSTITNSILNRDESFFTSYSYRSSLNRSIHISTRLCSFGKQVLEKVEISESPQCDQSERFIYRFDRSSLCEYMIQFIQKLRSLPNTSMMNSVLENFTILQVIKSRDDSEELLLCLAFVFEIAVSDGNGPQYQVYKLIAS